LPRGRRWERDGSAGSDLSADVVEADAHEPSFAHVNREIVIADGTDLGPAIQGSHAAMQEIVSNGTDREIMGK
jgi:hypothetical protein